MTADGTLVFRVAFLAIARIDPRHDGNMIAAAPWQDEQAMKIDKLAVWINTIGYRSADLVAFARRLEGWGYGTLWINDGMGSDPMVLAARILAGTERLQVALGVANIYSRDPTMMMGAQYGLNEQWDGRFLLGMGASHAFIVEGMRGHAYGKPVATMRAYLEAMAAVGYPGPQPDEKPPTVIAALGPKMLELARSHADGAHPFATTPGHTAMAREILGPGKLLLVEQKVMLESDAEKARAGPCRRPAPACRSRSRSAGMRAPSS
jgi:probable F420-dependent oxidoreductase